MTNSTRTSLPQADTSLSAPVAKRLSHRFSHHGIEIEDPYHWLRDPDYPKVENTEILSHLKAENTYFEAHMAPHQALVEELFAEIKGRQPVTEESVPYTRGEHQYQWRFNAGAQYRSWYRAPLASPDAWQLMLDENQLAAGLEFFKLGGMALSPNARYLSWACDMDGSERFTLKIRDLETGEDLPLSIEDTYGSPVWAADNKHMFYTLVNEQWRPDRIMRHELGTPLSADALVYTEVDEGFRVGLDQTQSDAYLMIVSGDHVTSDVKLLPSDAPLSELLDMAPREAGHEYSVDHRAGYFYILSNDTHKNFRLVRTPEQQPGPQHWQTIVAASDEQYLTGHLAFRDHLVLTSRINGLDTIQLLHGEEHQITTLDFPEATYSVGLGSNAEYVSNTLRLSYESMVTPGTVYDYHIESKQLELLKVQEIPSGYDAEQLATERLLVSARDGVQVPVSIVYPKNFPRDGSGKLYLYGYGAYGYAIEPGFSTSRLSLLDRGYAFAIAHIRGGDDLGYHWYEQGKLEQRTNTFNDFVDVAEHLIAAGYSSAGNIAIAGGSAGGELMGAVVNQAPQLWGAVAAHVPFVDVLCTMLDATLPLTPAEWPEWGNPITDPVAFEYIQSYSPVDQLKAGDYPPMLVTAGLNDPRVTYWEPAKYVAKLRHLKQDTNCLLLKTNMGAGHGGKSGRFDSITEVAEEYAFILLCLGFEANPTT
jgi:oligopeptidase B